MFRLTSSVNYKLCRKLDLSVTTCVQSLCSESSENDVVPQRQKPLRRRRVLRPAAAVPADAVNSYRMYREMAEQSDSFDVRAAFRRHPIGSDHHSVDSLKFQLDDVPSVPQLETDLEFPSDAIRHENPRDQARHAFRPRISPLDTSIVLFPGQSSHFVGMGAKLLSYPGVERLYKSASNILGYNLLDMCLHGPKDVLSKTIHSQPAVLVTSLAAVEKLKEVCPKAIENCISVAGYDVGEYAALVFAGAMSFEDAVRIVKIRASAMQAASNLIPGGMIRVHYGASGKVSKACHMAKNYCRQELDMPYSVCNVTTYLYPGCKIISGHQEALDFIRTHRHEFGIKKVEQLSVPGAFHCRLMHSTVSAVTRAIAAIELRKPVVPVFGCATSRKYQTVESIRKQLVEQMWTPVRWEQLMHVLYSRKVGAEFPMTFEVGPGHQLGFLLQQVNDKAYKQYDCVEV